MRRATVGKIPVALKIAVILGVTADMGLPHLRYPEIKRLQRLGSGVGKVLAFGCENDPSGNVDNDDAIQHGAEFNRLGQIASLRTDAGNQKWQLGRSHANFPDLFGL